MTAPGESVWITGVGAATPAGCDFPAIAASLLAGRSGISAIERFPTTDYPCQFAGQIAAIPCPPGSDVRAFAARSPLERAVVWSIDSALRDSGLRGVRREARVGLVFGIGAEWMVRWEADFLSGGGLVFSPDQPGESTLERIRREIGLPGPSLTLSAACASGNHALEVARGWLRMGLVDVCVAGACEMAVTPLGLATFGNLRALSRRNDDPAGASRPFDRSRDGFVLGEGGVAFVLERAEDARRRCASVYGEVAGCGSSSDAYHHVIPSPDPAPAAAAMTRALADAGVNPDQVDYVNAHATSTPVGDSAEAAVLRAALGHALDRIPVSSTKSMTGHLLTAAGAVEAIACLAAMKAGAIPPTINLRDPDVDLNLVGNEARPHPVRVAVSNSFGFGGSNTCLVLRSV